MKLFREHFSSLTLLLAIVSMTLPGLQAQDALPTSYSNSEADSVNGISVFAEMLRSYGCDVKNYQNLTYATDQADLVIWIPDRLDAPNREEFEMIVDRYRENNWTTFMIVGRDYDAAVDYWQTVIELLPEDQRGRGQDQLNREMFNWKSMRGRTGRRDTTDLMRYRVRDRWEPATRISGELAEGVNGSETGIVLTGEPDFNRHYSRFYVEELLTVDGEGFVFSMEQSSAPYLDFLFVSNGSLLLNLPLVNKENRKIAQNLIEYIDPIDVVILQSGSTDITEGSPEVEKTSFWQWMGVGPFRWIIPHMMLLGILYCFCYFPIFGRARKLPPAKVSSFATHLQAVGALLEKTGKKQHARDMIENYKKRSGHKSSAGN